MAECGAARQDILGCNVAQGETGAQFISELESVYRVNVAASDDATAAIRQPPLCCGANDMDRENDMILETYGVDVTQVRAPWLAPPAASAHGLFTAQVYFDATIAQWSGQLGVPTARCGRRCRRCRACRRLAQ